MKKDTTSKKIIKSIAEDIAKYILELNIDEVIEFVDKEFQRIEKREADIVVKCKINGVEEILHIEIQNSNDSKMPIRMMRYYTDIRLLYPKLPIRQYLLYIGKRRCRIKDRVEEENRFFCYNLIDMHTVDCEKFISMDTPDALVLSILCDFKGKDEREIIKYIITRLRELTQDDEKRLEKYMVMLDTLSTNRNLEDVVKEVQNMIRNTKLEDLPTYQLMMERGMERGIEKGIKEGLQKGLQKGIEKGIQKGIQKGKLESAITMIKEFGLSVKDVAEKLKLSEQELNRYLKEE